MHRRWQPVSLVAALLYVSMTACINWPDAEVRSRQPDKLLFERAMSAVEQKRFNCCEPNSSNAHQYVSRFRVRQHGETIVGGPANRTVRRILDFLSTVHRRAWTTTPGALLFLNVL